MTIFLLFFIIGLINFLYILGSNNAFWYNEFKLLKKEKGRAEEVYLRSLGYALFGFVPVWGIILSFLSFQLTNKQKHGFRLKKYD